MCNYTFIYIRVQAERQIQSTLFPRKQRNVSTIMSRLVLLFLSSWTSYYALPHSSFLSRHFLSPPFNSFSFYLRPLRHTATVPKVSPFSPWPPTRTLIIVVFVFARDIIKRAKRSRSQELQLYFKKLSDCRHLS